MKLSPDSSITFPRPSPIRNKYCANSFYSWISMLFPCFSLMFLVSFNNSIWFHRYERFKQLETIDALLSCFITGKICLKSPPKTKTFPPNGKFSNCGSTCFIMSRKVLSAALYIRLSSISASSHINIFDKWINFAASEFSFILHVEMVFSMWNVLFDYYLIIELQHQKMPLQ